MDRAAAPQGVGSANDDEARLRIHVYDRIGHLLVEDVRPRHCRELVDALIVKMNKGELAPRTVRHVYGTLHTLFQHAVAIDEAVTANPCTLPNGYLPEKRQRSLMEADGEVRAR